MNAEISDLLIFSRLGLLICSISYVSKSSSRMLAVLVTSGDKCKELYSQLFSD